MDAPWFDILLIFSLLVANGLFAMTEIAMVSSRKVRLEQRAEEGDRGAQEALKMAQNPTNLLSTVQIGITLVGIFSGALGGAALADDLAGLIGRVPVLLPYKDTLALAIVVLLITYFSLVIGELIPKRLALINPERVATTMARPMKLLSRAAAPVVALLTVSTNIGLRLLGAKPSGDPPVTEEEVKGLIEQGTKVGIFEAAEQNIVESVFRLADRRVDAVMTPRTEIVWIDLDDSLQEISEKVLRSSYSRMPVARGSLDNVLGILVAKDFLVAQLRGDAIDLQEILERPYFVPESMPALKALDLMREYGIQMALVVDEYGGILGMITMLDIFKSIVGEIPNSGEVYRPMAVQREDGSWLIDGTIQVDELKELLDIDDLPQEERVGYQTLGGLMMSQMGEIPNEGSAFEWNGLRFEVIDMDGRRVDKVLITSLQGGMH